MAHDDNTPAMQFIRIVNWSRFQHYKHRNPPWIKLYREFLSSRTWVTADDASRVLAVALMLLAGEHDNKIPLDMTYIMRVAYLDKRPDLSGLLDSHFIEIIDSASKPLAPCKQDASNLHQNADSETETEKSRGREKTCSKLTSSTSEPAAPFITLPCVGNGRKDYPVTAEQIGHWREQFPGVDVAGELRHAQAWLEANPTRRKTAKGIPRFIVRWLGKSQDRPKSNAHRTSLADTVQREREEMVHAAVSKR